MMLPCLTATVSESRVSMGEPVPELENAVKQTQANNDGSPRCRVLVIDDDVDIRESTAAVISMLGHDVETAVDGPSGVEAGRIFLPQLVLLDVGLPGMDGYGVARLVRVEPWGTRVLLAAMTGWVRDSDRDAATNAGFDVHVAKPVNLRTLQDLIERAASAHGLPGMAASADIVVDTERVVPRPSRVPS